MSYIPPNTNPSLETGGHLEGIDTKLGTRFLAGKSSYAALLNTAGDSAVITPPAGQRVVVYWVAFVPDSDNTAANLITVKFATSGQNLYMGYALAHSEEFTGNTNEPLTINLSNTQPVAVTVHYRTIT